MYFLHGLQYTVSGGSFYVNVKKVITLNLHESNKIHVTMFLLVIY